MKWLQVLTYLLTSYVGLGKYKSKSECDERIKVCDSYLMILYSSQSSKLIRQQHTVLFITRGVRIVRKSNQNLNLGQFALGIQESLKSDVQIQIYESLDLWGDFGWVWNLRFESSKYIWNFMEFYGSMSGIFEYIWVKDRGLQSMVRFGFESIKEQCSYLCLWNANWILFESNMSGLDFYSELIDKTLLTWTSFYNLISFTSEKDNLSSVELYKNS